MMTDTQQQQQLVQVSSSSPTAAANNKNNKRCIRFRDQDSLCRYHDGVAILDLVESPKDIWYQHNEMTHMKRKAMIVSKEAHRYGFGSLLTNTYGRVCDATQDALNGWCRNGNSRRGLERWINNEYAAKRADIRRRTIQSVLRAQQKMREENINDVGYSMKVLSRLSEAFSQDSRTFALNMGRADEHAATVDPDPDHMECEMAHKKKVSSMRSSSSSSQHINRMRGPSPRGVAVPPTTRRNLGLSGTTPGAGDFRHYC